MLYAVRCRCRCNVWRLACDVEFIAMDDIWHVPHRRTLELTASANVERGTVAVIWTAVEIACYLC
jgi:hypothetical protein